MSVTRLKRWPKSSGPQTDDAEPTAKQDPKPADKAVRLHADKSKKEGTD